MSTAAEKIKSRYEGKFGKYASMAPPREEQDLTVPDEDKASLEQFVKELRDLPPERSAEVTDILRNGNIYALLDVLRDDDGVIDVAESKLA